MSRAASEETSDDETPRSLDVVDPQIRAHLHSLCTALGGSSLEAPGTYTLGDDALAVLKDLRRWLKLYDEKLNRYDVARCLSEAKLVNNDLLEILAGWRESETNVGWKHRIMLACVELLAPLTWPFPKHDEQKTVNHHRHMPVLEYAQMGYKRGILHHSSGRTLKDIVRVALPSMALPPSERSERDEGIIRIILYVLRNVVIIEHPNPTEMDTGEDIGRSSTIKAFSKQNVLDLLLTLCSGVADEFRNHETVLTEILYHLVKGVDVESVFRDEEAERKKKASDLTRLLKMEDDRVKNNARTSSRHNRFGTSVWVERNDGVRAFVSGQDALLGKRTGIEKMDKTKKWSKPHGADNKGVSRKTEFDVKTELDLDARRILKVFIENFIDSGFNPLFMAMRRGLDRDVDRLLVTPAKQFFYVTAWFLKAERVRRSLAARDKSMDKTTVSESFAVVAGVLNQEFIICLHRRLQEWFDLHLWNELHGGMRCFTQIMYTVSDMAHSPLEDDQEIAENIQNRLFYEESLLQLVPDILRSHTKQPFRWLDDCTEMVHVHLKLLEKYSQQHEHMFIRSRRRQNRKKKDAQLAAGEDLSGDEDEAALVAQSQRAATDRAFNFSRFEARYLNQRCIDSFIKYLSYYRELDGPQIMRAIKFLHRIFEKRKSEIILFRVDIVDLLYRMMQGSEALPRSHPAYKHADQFVRHYLRRLFKKLEREPAMYIELLFTKLNSTLYYLEHGEQRPLPLPPKPRAAAEWQFKPSKANELTLSDKISVLVGQLLFSDAKVDEIDWLKQALQKAAVERESQESLSAALALEADPSSSNPPLGDPPPEIRLSPPDTDPDIAASLLKSSKFRLLLKTLGLEERSTTPGEWFLPSSLKAAELIASLSLLTSAVENPQADDSAEELLQRVPLQSSRKRRADDALSSSSSDSSELEIEIDPRFAPDGPLPSRGKLKKAKKSSGKKRQRRELDDEEKKLRKKEKRERELERLMRIKSEMYIYDSDEMAGDDEEFFRREREIRAKGPRPLESGTKKKSSGKEKGGKRKEQRRIEEEEDMVMGDSGDSTEEDDDDRVVDMRSPSLLSGSSDEEEVVIEDEGMDSPLLMPSTAPPPEPIDIDDEDIGPVNMSRPRRAVAVVIDSDDE